MKYWNDLKNLLRINHWQKNIVCFLPLLAAKKYDFLPVTILVFKFSLLSSMIYIFNDYIDRFSDKNHPSKKNRYVVKCKENDSFIKVVFSLIVLINILISFTNQYDLNFVFFIYVFLNLAYTYAFKNIRYLDLVCLVIFYLCRLYSGAIVSGIEVSAWLLVLTSLMFVNLASLKRYVDLNQIVDTTYRGYKKSDMNTLKKISYSTIIIGSIVLLSYIQFSDNMKLLHTNNIALLSSVIIFIFTSIRVTQNVTKQNSRNELIKDVLRDKNFVIGFIVFILVWIIF